MNKKKVAIIHDSMNVGGTEKALIYMLNGLDYTKYDVELWLLNNNGPLQGEIDHHVVIRNYSNNPVKIGQLFKYYLVKRSPLKALKAVIAKFKSRINLNVFYKNMIYDIQSLPNLSELVYDAVIVYQGLYINLLTTAIFRVKAKKRIAWIHMKFNHSPDNQKLFGEMFREIDHVFCVSRDIQKHFDRFYGKYNRQSSVLYNILNEKDILAKAEEPINYHENDPYLLTVGRISPEKGMIMIPEIAGLLRADGYQFKWLIIGDGSQRQELAEKIKKNNLYDTVLLLGSLINPYPYYKNCMIYVQPSYSEGYCTSTCEAKIFLKPIVTTDVSGMREQITDGYTGFITDIDVNSLYKKIRELLDDPDIMVQFSKNLKNQKNTYNDYYELLYKELDSAEQIRKH